MQVLASFIQEIASRFEAQKIKNVMDLQDLFNSYSTDDWQKAMKRKNGKFQTTILFENQQFRLLLIHWESGKKSKKHGHPEGGGLIKVLSGTLLETRFDPKETEKIIGEHYYYQGSGTSYIHDSIAYHQVENPSTLPAISLHLYSPGISASKVISGKESHLVRDERLKPAA